MSDEQRGILIRLCHFGAKLMSFESTLTGNHVAIEYEAKGMCSHHWTRDMADVQWLVAEGYLRAVAADSIQTHYELTERGIQEALP